MEISDFKLSKTQNWFCEFLGYEIEVNLEIDDEELIEDFKYLVNEINKWDAGLFRKIQPMLFSYYQDTLLCCGETEPVIDNEEDIWEHVSIGALYLFSHDSLCYVMASGGCDWEEEHGLEIDLDETGRILYVGSFISNGFQSDPKNPRHGNYVKANLSSGSI